MTEIETKMILRNQALILTTLAILIENSGEGGTEFAEYLAREARAILEYVGAPDQSKSVTE